MWKPEPLKRRPEPLLQKTELLFTQYTLADGNEG